MLLAYDGVCVLCNGFVRFLIKRDPQKRIQFTTNYSKTGAALFAASGQDNRAPTSVILTDGEARYFESDAALRAIAALGSGWQFVSVFRVVPPFIRNPVYRFIATRRYRWFGKLDACPVVPAIWQDRFIA